MLATFRIKKPLGPRYTVDPDDTTRAKTAFARLRFYKIPEWGITPWVDSSMMDGIAAFQKANGLKVDSVIKPGGPLQTNARIEDREEQVRDEHPEHGQHR